MRIEYYSQKYNPKALSAIYMEYSEQFFNTNSGADQKYLL